MFTPSDTLTIKNERIIMRKLTFFVLLLILLTFRGKNVKSDPFTCPPTLSCCATRTGILEETGVTDDVAKQGSTSVFRYDGLAYLLDPCLSTLYRS